MTVRIRRAEPADVDFLLELATHEDVEPYMSVRRPRDRESLLEEIERSAGEPQDGGTFVIEVEEGRWLDARRHDGVRRLEQEEQDRQPRRARDSS